MSNRPATAKYFTTVIAIAKDTAVLGGHLYVEGDDPTVTRFSLCNQGSWGHLFDMDDVVYGTTKRPGTATNPRGAICLLGRYGSYREVVSGTPPTDASLSIRDAGYLMDICCVDGCLYACGIQNIVYRESKGTWSRMDTGIFSPLGEQVDRSLESIDGFSADDIYAVGDEGAIWHWDGTAWIRLESLTNLPFYSVLCASSGDVYIGGSNGLLFKGSASSGWGELTDHALTTDVIEDMAEFQGHVYLCATEDLLRTDGATLDVVDVPVEGEKAFYAIDAVEDGLWVVGDECVLQFDGTTWVRHVSPDNI
jgi:hypothetical protein